MATVTAIDYRRTDLRTNVLENPFWITSNAIYGPNAEDKAAILFSFPTASRVVLIHEICFQVLSTVFTGGTVSGTLGVGTIATDAVTTGGDVTTVDVDDYMVTADITWGTAGYYYPTSGSDFLTAKAAGSLTGPVVIVGAATTVPVIVAYLASTTTMTDGYGRVHALISVLPGF